MYIFLTFFFTVYGLIHLFFLLKLRRVTELKGLLLIFVLVILTLLWFMPVVIRILERNEHFNVARILAYIGYTWMAAVFLFFVISVFVDIISLFVSFAVKTRVVATIVLIVLLIVYGFFEARTITLERVKIKTSKLPSGTERLKIVQISDLHLGLIIREKRVESLITLIKELKPDILVATGDIVDGQANDILNHTEIFSDLKPPLGKYAITGNHEYYAGIEQSVLFIEKSGFRLLRGEAINVAGIINIAGVDDMGNTDERRLLSQLNKERFTLFLRHRPVVKKETIGFFDLQLSGHTHKGQIFPFYFITKLAFPLNSGLYQFSGNSFEKKQEREVDDKKPLLYTSRGTGTWGPPLRILAPPEILLIELERK